MSNEKISKLCKLLEKGTIGIPKEVMKLEGFDINTKIVYSVLLNNALKNNQDKTEFINRVNSISLDFIFENAVVKSEKEAKQVQRELPVLSKTMFESYP